MVNDESRNRAYKEALAACEGTVLDIGCGTGILSIYAAMSPQCSSVIACELSEPMCVVANTVLFLLVLVSTFHQELYRIHRNSLN